MEMHNENNKITYLFPLSITPLEMPPKEIEKKRAKANYYNKQILLPCCIASGLLMTIASESYFIKCINNIFLNWKYLTGLL